MTAPAVWRQGQGRKVRASQGRMPDNVRWRRLQGKCNRNKPPMSKSVARYPGRISEADLFRLSAVYCIGVGKGGKAV